MQTSDCCCLVACAFEFQQCCLDGPEAQLPAVNIGYDRNAVLTLQMVPHNIFSSEHSLNGVQLACMRPGTFADSAAFSASQALQMAFRSVTTLVQVNEHNWLRRLSFLSVMSAAPGRALAGTGNATAGCRWVQGLVSESEREKLRLDILLHLQAPGLLSRALLSTTQAALECGYSLAHVVSPKFCRWLVGYVEEESVKAYTQLLKDIDSGLLPKFAGGVAPAAARAHFALPEGAPLSEVFKCMLAEGMHSR